MAGRKFNFNAAESLSNINSEEKKKSSKKENLKKTEQNKTKPNPTNHPIETQKENLDGKAGALVQKISTASEPKAFNFRFVPREKLNFYENNEYPQEKIESLAEKILNVGLIHNLEVFYVLDTDTYIIDSGERRCHALDMLINKYKNFTDHESAEYKKYLTHVKQFENGYPCNVRLSVGTEDLDKIDLRIRHYIANEEVRDRDPVRTAERIAELNTLYSLRNESSDSEKININKKIGEDLGISDRQVKKYKSIQKLIPELQEKFQENEITLTEGSNYASLSEEEQRQLLNLINSNADKKKVDELYQRITTMKKEIASKENAIKSLENEQKEAKKKMEQAQNEIARLQDKLKQETEKEVPQPEKVNELEQKIADANKNLDLQKKEHEKNLKNKDKEIELLKEELNKQKNSHTEFANGYQESIKLNIQIESVKRAIDTLKDCYETYKKAYTDQNTTSPTPEKYLSDISELLKKASEMIK